MLKSVSEIICAIILKYSNVDEPAGVRKLEHQFTGVSRLTEHGHWASDFLGGALIGYSCGRQATSAFFFRSAELEKILHLQKKLKIGK